MSGHYDTGTQWAVRRGADSTITQLAAEPGAGSSYAAINRHGAIAGRHGDIDEILHASRWATDATPTPLPGLPGYSDSWASAINNRGVVAREAWELWPWGEQRCVRERVRPTYGGRGLTLRLGDLARPEAGTCW